MIRTVLIALLVCFLVALVFVFFARGGGAALSGGASPLPNPIDLIFGTGGEQQATFKLPWQPESLGDYAVPIEGVPAGYTPESEAPAHTGSVHLYQDPSGPQTSDPTYEYIQIEADADLSGPKDLSGWSLQSAFSGVRVPVAPVQFSLAPGASAYIMSGGTPGTSSFDGYAWRIRLGSRLQIWHDEHDTIHLLDARGAVVDTLSY